MSRRFELFKLISIKILQEPIQTLFKVREESSFQSVSVRTPVNVRQVKGFLLVCDWLHSVGQNHFYVMMLFIQGCYFIQSLHFSYELQEYSMQNSKRCSSAPLHPFGWCGILSGHSSIKASSVWMSFYVQKLRTVLGCIHPDVSVTRLDAFQYSTSQRISFQNTYERTTTTVRTSWLFCPDAILDKASLTEDVQSSECQTPWFGLLGLNMEIKCSRSATVQVPGQHRPDKALFRKEFQAKLESRLHNCLSWCPQLPSGHCLGKSYQTEFRFL